MLTRRRLLQSTGASLALTLSGAKLALADAPTQKRFVFIFLRGGTDGLHVLSPYMDRAYQSSRPTLALKKPGEKDGVIDLDGYFGLHPALEQLTALYKDRELLLVPAASTRYQNRSHFDGQNMLENGSGKPYGARDGWLNRAIAGLNQQESRVGLALGHALPLIMQGDTRLQTWSNSRLPKADEDFLRRMQRMYESDPLFAKTLAQANGALQPMLSKKEMKPGRNNRQFTIAAKAAADLLARDKGPRIAVMELQGWDTHFGQAFRSRALFKQLADAIVELKTGLGASWQDTVIMAGSEFGRTLAENASRGTDHGTASMAMLAGGAVAGGKIAGQWRGLSGTGLRDSRDVATLNHYERMFKSILISHLGLPQAQVEDDVFPNSAELTPMEGLLKAG